MENKETLINVQTFDKDVDEINNEDIAKEAENIKADMIMDINDSITTYDEENTEKTEHDSSVEDINEDEILQKVETNLNGVDAEIVIKNVNDETKTKEEIDKIVDEKHIMISKQVKNKASLLRKEHEMKLSYKDYNCEAENFINYNNIIFGTLTFPESNVIYERETKNLCSTNTLVRELSMFKDFDVFHLPDEKMIHSLPEILLIATDVNKLFKHTFMTVHGSVRLNVNEIESNIFKFLKNKKDIPSLLFETRFINAIMNKLIMILNTDVEFAFRDNTIKADDEFLIAINEDIKNMENIQNKSGKQYAMWRVFVEALCSVRFKKSERLIYKHESYEKLNTILKEVLNDESLLIHELFGNMLKCYLPTIIFSYFFMLRSIHIMGRLITIYVQEKMFEGKNKDQQVKDVYNIAAICTIIYENKYNLWKNIIKSPITVRAMDDKNNEAKQLSEKAQLYLYNHVICGGQYFLLKTVEKYLPVIVNNF